MEENERGKAWRRSRDQVSKKEALRKAKARGLPTDERFIGKQAAVHSRKCSCYICRKGTRRRPEPLEGDEQ